MTTHDDDPGFQLDLIRMGVNPARRELLAWLGAVVLLPVVGCAGDKGDESGGDDSSAAMTPAAATPRRRAVRPCPKRPRARTPATAPTAPTP
jgi:hypothetical protein